MYWSVALPTCVNNSYFIPLTLTLTLERPLTSVTSVSTQLVCKLSRCYWFQDASISFPFPLIIAGYFIMAEMIVKTTLLHTGNWLRSPVWQHLVWILHPPRPPLRAFVHCRSIKYDTETQSFPKIGQTCSCPLLSRRTLGLALPTNRTLCLLTADQSEAVFLTGVGSSAAISPAQRHAGNATTTKHRCFE